LDTEVKLYQENELLKLIDFAWRKYVNNRQRCDFLEESVIERGIEIETILDQLLAKDYITIEPNPYDVNRVLSRTPYKKPQKYQRIYHAVLTDKGREQLTPMAPPQSPE